MSRFDPYGFQATNSGVKESPVKSRVLRQETGMIFSLSKLVVYLTHPRVSSPERPEPGERISRGSASFTVNAEA